MANIIAVSALNKYVKSILESDPVLTDIAIKGEISNFNRHYKSGHCYFSLKDETASVKAVMFRSDAQRLAFTPQDGMSVLARCRVSLYERDGAFQLYVEDLFPDGMGAAQLAFEQLKERLLKEGLFAEERKKPVARYPRRVGVVTSKTGAALQDILQVTARRYPAVTLVLAPVTVQGMAAAEEIAAAIRTLDETGEVDTIIVARGGGSAEDLWVFNAEVIARAAFAAKTPIISAIGHEIDYTILDFVADLRAPTPSAAAELALPDLQVVHAQINTLYMNIVENMQFKLDSWYNMLEELQQKDILREMHRQPIKYSNNLLAVWDRITQATKSKTNAAGARLQAAANLAAGVNPYAVLARGYSVATLPGGEAVRSVTQVQKGQKIKIQVTDGHFLCDTLEVCPNSNKEEI